MGRAFTLILTCVTCSAPRPAAPPIIMTEAGPTVVRDANGAADVHRSDRYRPLDIGSGVRPDTPILSKGQHDAGYELTELPDPASMDPCGHMCRGRPCARECRETCRLELPRVPVAQRERFIDCAAQNSCSIEQCVPGEAPTDAACEALCRNTHLRTCGLPELAEAGPRCPAACTSYLASMYPAARQAFLQCGMEQCVASNASCAGSGFCEQGERCGAGRCVPEKQCPLIDFVGPEPSAECLDVARYRQRCHHPRATSLYHDAWECEGWRPNRDNLSWAGGNHYISCLTQLEACDGYEPYWQCLGEAMVAKGRRRLVDEVCTHIQGCDRGKGWTCNYVMAGASRWAGERVVWKLDRCSAEAGMDCRALNACVDGLWALEGPDDACSIGCGRCGQLNDSCINLCLYHRNSMTFQQADRYEHCLRANPDCDRNVAETCIREVFEPEMRVCDQLLETIGQCAEWEAVTQNHPWPGWCAIGGIRTGLLNAQQLDACVDRTNCRVNPWRACAR